MRKEVRFFKRSEKEMLLDAIDRLWAHNHIYVRNPAVLEHLVWDTPYREELTGKDNYAFVGMWVDDEIVGMRGSIPQEANVFGKVVKSETGTIWIVKKKKGISLSGADMQTYVDQKWKTEISISMGISDIAMKIDKISGLYTLDDVPRWIAINRLEETLQYLLPDDTMCPCLPIIKNVSMNDSYQIVIDDLDQDRWDQFYFESVAPYTIGTCRDYKFLHWRYMKSPVLKYHFLAVQNRGGKYLGLAVIRIESILDGKCTIGRILEFISFNVEASIMLANAIINYNKDVLMWDFYCFSDVTAFGLETVGFRKIPEWNDKVMMPARFQPVDYQHMKINATVFMSDSIKSRLNPISLYQWYLTKGDADQDRAN